MEDNLQRAIKILNSESLRERLAAIEHERWSDWQRYLHDKCDSLPDGSLVIPAQLVNRWNSQMHTPYAELSQDERRSDRVQVDRYLPVIEEELKRLRNGRDEGS